MYRYYYNTEGRVVRRDTHSVLMSKNPTQPYVDNEELFDYDAVKVNLETLTLEAHTWPVVTPTVPWDAQRRQAYGAMEFQLNQLYDDITAGFFGEAAKSSTWYQYITQVKQDIPKD